MKNISYLCTRLVEETTLTNGEKFLRKVFQKKLQKYLEVWKTCLTFATDFRLKAERLKESSEALVTAKQEYEFFEDIEQLRKFYSLLIKSNFKQYLWD